MERIYNKLVRDNIPNIIKEKVKNLLLEYYQMKSIRKN